jgi:cobalt-zinc-cadmium efflux system membrane fusion protein
VKIRFLLCLVLPLLISSLLPGCGPPAFAAEVTPAPASSPDPAQDEIEPMVTTLFGERVLLFMENPRLVVGESARFLAHFSVLATGEPIRSGRVVLKVGTTTLVVDAPKRDGLFIPEGSFTTTGSMRVTLSVESDQASETLDLGEFTVHATSADARRAAEAEAEDEPAGAVPFLMEQQWKVKTLLGQAAPRQLTKRLIVPADVVLAEGAAAVVSAPMSGRWMQPEADPFATTGTAVGRGQLLGYVEPPLTASDAAQLRALEHEWEMKSVEWDMMSLDVEKALADATVGLQFAESEHDRLAELLPSGLATQRQLAQSERDIALARGSLVAAVARKEALVDLLHQHANSHPEFPGGTLRFPVRAPIEGVIIRAERVLGESVEAGAPLMRIVDASDLWIEGRISEFDLVRVGEAPTALVSFPALPGHRLSVGGNSAAAGTAATIGRLLTIGPEIDTASRTAVIRFELPDAGRSVRPGMLADLEIAVASADADVAIPWQAVVMDQGAPTAYVMISGETFVRRDLELGLRDGGFVEVLSGIAAGEHVATRAAGTIRMAALSPASFGHGHEH